MINLENNYFDILNDVFTIIKSNSLYMFVLSLCIYVSVLNFIIRLVFKVSCKTKESDDITYAEEYENNECENDDRFNYGFFKK